MESLRDQLLERPTDQLVPVITEEHFPLRIDLLDRATLVHHHAVGRRFDQRTKLFLGFSLNLQRRLVTRRLVIRRRRFRLCRCYPSLPGDLGINTEPILDASARLVRLVN